jgi:hypothetical protein
VTTHELAACTVPIENGDSHGTGFFVLPRRIVTCAHVVAPALKAGTAINVKYRGTLYPARLGSALPPTLPAQEAAIFPDIALLEIDDELDHPIVQIDHGAPRRGDQICAFGYSDFYANGDDVTLEFEGAARLTESRDGHFLKFSGGQVRPGHSGSPLLNSRTQRVCGMLKASRDRASDLGGLGVSCLTMLWHFPSLGDNADAQAALPPPIVEAENRPPLGIRLSRLRQRLGQDWLLSFLGEDQLQNLAEIVRDLRSDCKIQSKFAYWGPVPTYHWDMACNDASYTMKDSIEEVKCCVPGHDELLSRTREREHCFLSLGPGTGEKDARLLPEIFGSQFGAITYIPVEMSLEMLRLGLRKIRSGLGSRLNVPVAVQADIEHEKLLSDSVSVAKTVADGKPLIFSLLGNTISNTEDPLHELRLIRSVMTPEDLLLLEAWIVDTGQLADGVFERDLGRKLSTEYSSDAFRPFAISGLRQNSTLPIRPDDPDNYRVEVTRATERYGTVAQIDCFLYNNSRTDLVGQFYNGHEYRIKTNGKVRLYRSRRYDREGLTKLVQSAQFTIHGLQVSPGSEVALLSASPK